MNNDKQVRNMFISAADLFNMLDSNGDGILEFEELLAEYYMDHIDVLRCGGCENLLLGKTNYSLCYECYPPPPLRQQIWRHSAHG
ncbi:hypothetical protein C2S53_020138 [Perilla frutescens var. hirtella]|uniref:EF-hand domain-containing protein n=1 Tax=Perilla frutescens var. hirtella TaxID=608512 RepID=A0AAD4J0M0_PERFH|nr:hypothetical protein C2S53_020138 [Perilla frutescens var. hirtella]